MADQTIALREPQLEPRLSGRRLTLAAHGAWTVPNADALEHLIETFSAQQPERAEEPVKEVAIDMGAVDALDTYGAWLIERLFRRYAGTGQELHLIGVAERYRGLIDEIHDVNRRQRRREAAREPAARRARIAWAHRHRWRQ